ncbi:MAG: hypothetical protein HY578_05460 [Nitrospinae bacterium]|nr:hypothetical protein [Nitrospinota bacterium]
MSKVQIIGSRRIMEEVIEHLHSLSLLHIESIPEDIKRNISYHIIPLHDNEVILKERAEKLLHRLEDLIILLPRPSAHLISAMAYPSGLSSEIGKEGGLKAGKGEFMITDILSDKFLSDFDVLENKLRDLHKKKSELEEGLSLIERYERILKSLAPLISRLSELKHIESTGIIIDKDKAAIIPLLEGEIKEITDGMYQIFKRELDRESIGVILTYQKDYDEKVRALLSGEGISEIRLPAEYSDLPLFDALKHMIRKREEFPVEISSIEKELERLSRDWYLRIEDLLYLLKELVNEFKTLSYCTCTNYTFFIFGWIPQIYLDKLKDSIKRKFGERVMVIELKIQEGELETVPVSIKNPGILKSFELFMNFLPPPRYDSVDPTPFLAIFFPVFFGLILGDSGYGLILLFAVIYLWFKYKENTTINDVVKIFFLCSLSSIIFGILFGEFFGELGERFGMHPILLDRVRAIKGFLILTIAIGIGHVLLGFIISLISSIFWRRKKEALGTASSILMLFALFLLVSILADYLPKEFLTMGIIITIVAFPILLISGGIISMIELIKSVSNVLSYARIMALGVASVTMAVVANRLGEMSGNIILGIIIASLIHALNIIIGVFSPTIQSLRLHYVEFFSKFYKAGNRRYNPFKKIRGEVKLWRRV